MPPTLSMARNHKFTAAEQFNALTSCYPNSFGELRRNGFTWSMWVRPEESCHQYKIRIKYVTGYPPRTYIAEPCPLRLAEGATGLPHTYDSKQQRLCLYHPDLFEWDSSMLIANTIVHWAIQWLIFYEIWQLTGVWSGGGHGNHDVKTLK